MEVKIPERTDINRNMILERLRIDPLADLKEPPVCCWIDEKPSMTAGNFSLIVGKAKSGKTFIVGSLVAGLLSSRIQLDAFRGSLPEDKRNGLYFDTEQSAYHANRTIKRICALIDNPNPSNLVAYSLRPLIPAERLKAIEDAIRTVNNLGFVVIDGVRDLLTIGINDEAEATSLTSKFLKWTAEYNIHLILLLHQNKTDLNARGHIGTELLNKAETTISVTKDQKRNIFVVSCEYSRDMAFENFAFTIDDGLPFPVELPEEGQPKSKNPQNILDEKHLTVLDSIFKAEPRPTYHDLQDRIIYRFNNSFGQTACRSYISHYLDKNWISKGRDGNKKYYQYERAIF